MELFSTSTVVFCIILPSIVFSARRLVREDTIECDGFETQQCLDLLYVYYGLSPLELSEYGYMQQAVLADSIECHYIYDVCPFYIPRITGEKQECIDGQSAFIDENSEIAYYDCRDVNLFSFIPIQELGSNNNASGADIWGYQTLDDDGNVNKHYAITSQADGSTIVDVTDPVNPHVLAFIVSNVLGELRNVLWRDVKVYKDFAIVVADTGGVDDHGIQLYNLTQIINDAEQFQLTSSSFPGEIYNVSKDDIIIYDFVGRCHNVYVDNDIGHLYAMGSNGINGNNCSTGIHIIDINDPHNPIFMGCYDGSSYVHDAQCVIYHGPDQDYQGHEICFMFTPTVGNLTIVDITDPKDVIEISSTTYFTSSYNHQGWVTSNHEYLLLDDETDEGPLPDRFPKTQNFTTTYIFDIRDLDNVDYRRPHRSSVLAVDHNQYIVDNGHTYSCNSSKFRGFTFQSNYEAGLRILKIDNIANEFGNKLSEIAYFDVFPWKLNSNGTSVYGEIKFFGSWSVYPYFNRLGTSPEEYIYSNTLIVQSTTTGLYVLEFEGDMDFSENTGAPSVEPTIAFTSTYTMETIFESMETTEIDHLDEDESFDFQWNTWYGYTSIVVMAILALIIIFMASKMIIKSRRDKKTDVYKSIVAMEKGYNYGTHNDTSVDQRM